MLRMLRMVLAMLGEVLSVVLAVLGVVLCVLAVLRVLSQRVWLLGHHLLLARHAVHAVQRAAAAGAVPAVPAGHGAAAAAAAAAALAGTAVVAGAVLPGQGSQEVVVLLVVKAVRRRREVISKDGVQQRVRVGIVQVAERGGRRVVQVGCTAGEGAERGRRLGGLHVDEAVRQAWQTATRPCLAGV